MEPSFLRLLWQKAQYKGCLRIPGQLGGIRVACGSTVCSNQSYLPQFYSLGFNGAVEWEVQTLYPVFIWQANGVFREKESLATVLRHSKMLWREPSLEFFIIYELSHTLSSYHGPWGTEWASGYICHVNCSLTCIRKDQSSVVKWSLTKLSNLVESLTSFQITWFDSFTLFPWEFLLRVSS